MASSDLVALYRRLRYLTIHIRRDSGPLFPIDPVDRPLLEELLVHSYLPQNGVLSLSHGIIPLASAPRLRRCGLQAWRPSQYTPLPPAWSQLTNLTLWGQTNVPDILRQCTNLINLELHFCSLYSSDEPPSLRPVLLPYLTELYIIWLDQASGLTYLDLPSLQDLTITIDSDNDETLVIPRECGRRIQRFRLNDADNVSPPREVEKYLASMPQLRHLYLEHPVALRILSTSVADDDRLLPKLRTIDTGSVRQCVVDVVYFIKVRVKPYNDNSHSIREICAWPAMSEAPSAEQLFFLSKCLDEGLILYDHADPLYRQAWPVRRGEEERDMQGSHAMSVAT